MNVISFRKGWSYCQTERYMIVYVHVGRVHVSGEGEVYVFGGEVTASGRVTVWWSGGEVDATDTVTIHDQRDEHTRIYGHVSGSSSCLGKGAKST